MIADVNTIGWSGSPLTKELLPKVSFVPTYEKGGGKIRKQLTRNMHCFDKDKQTVMQSLQSFTVLTLPTIDANGSETTIAYGGGWKLLSASESKAITGITLLQITYEKEVSELFEFNMPIGVSIVNTGSVTEIKYNGTTLESFESDTTPTTGLEILSSHNFNDAMEEINNGRTIDYTFFINEIEFDLTTLDIENCKYAKPTFSGQKTIGGPWKVLPEDEVLMEMFFASGAVGYGISTVYHQERVPIVDAPEGQFDENNSYIPKFENKTIPYFYMKARFEKTICNKFKTTFEPYWELANDVLKIKVENLTLRLWDVTGL